MKIKKRVGGLFLPIFLILLLSACGGGSGAAASTGGGTSTPPASNPGQTLQVSVSGLAGAGPLALQNNAGDALTVTANGSAAFSTLVALNSTYLITVSTQPPGQQCTVTNGSGTVTSSTGPVSISCANLAVAPALPTGPYVTAAVTVSRASPGEHLTSNFVGLSYEKSEISKAVLSGSDTALVTLLKQLGPGVLRIGGNSVNTTTWNANGTGSVSGTVAPADVDRLASLMTATGWKVIYGLNHATNTTTNIASEAQYAAQKFGSSLLGFEIGNEPDLYSSNGLRATTYTFADFLAEWQTYQSAILAVVPNAVFTGPASSWNVTGYTVPFAQQKGSEINLLTQHYYRANGQAATSTLALLLAGDPNLPAELQKLNTAAKSAGLSGGYRMAEANSFYNGGAPNVSDAYGTALWLLDFLFINAQNGSSGVNMHGGGTGPYTPITDNGTVANGARPEYYGLLVFSLAANGTMLNTQTTQSGTINLTSYAVAGDDGSTTVLLNNKDAANSAYVTVNLNITNANATMTANLTTLTGTALASTSGYTLDGSVIGSTGQWTPAPSMIYVTPEGYVTISVPPMSAILVRAH